MANSRIQIGLDFMANTSQAKKEIQSLITDLNKIQQYNVGTLGFNHKEIELASQAAAELKIHLSQALNTDTGKLDLTKFNQSLRTGSMSLQQLARNLQLVGNEGQSAFGALSTMIANAEMPVLNLSSQIQKLTVTLANTARWMLSSGMLNAGLGAIRNAYSYAQDLDKSLNRIQIVTKKNVNEMANFAKQANKAAQNLSSTTTKYTDASLIYYQQGLSDKEVKGRTDTTIKLANVTGQSAKEVSDQMTAIWNNFYDGSESLESYADSLTALGAATASSSAEIAQGMEKFAATANVIQLSYDYAAAAVATVVAQTRQSADVVGTSFKTIFARLEGLKLGETLEDGTELNQYSAALAKIGVDIKDANGELKAMDTILDEAGAKWQTLSRAEQVATAQTVAGLRQYQQFIALMDNYDKFKENVAISKDSEGELQAQQAIYEKSWQASIDRVKAAAEGIYDQLIDDQAFKDINNFIAEFLKSLGGVIESSGGLKTVLIGIASILAGSFADKVPALLGRIKDDFLIISGQGYKIYENQLKQIKAVSDEIAAKEDLNSYQRKELDLNNEVLAAKQTLIKILPNLSATQREVVQQAMDAAIKEKDSILEQTAALDEKIKALKKEEEVYKENLAAKERYLQKDNKPLKGTVNLVDTTFKENAAAHSVAMNLAESLASGGDNIEEVFTPAEKTIETLNYEIDRMRDKMSKGTLDDGKIESQTQKIQNFASSFVDVLDEPEKLKTALAELGREGLNQEQQLDALNNVLNILEEELVEVSDGLQDTETGVMDNVNAYATLGKMIGKSGIEKLPSTMKKNVEEAMRLSESRKKLKRETDNLTASEKALEEKLKNMANVKPIMAYSQAITTVASGVGQLIMAKNQLKGLGDIWNKDDISVGEKISQTLLTLSFLIPMVSGAFKAFQSVRKAELVLNNELLASLSTELTLRGLRKGLGVSENVIDILRLASKNKLAEAQKKLNDLTGKENGLEAEGIVTKFISNTLTEMEGGLAFKAALKKAFKNTLQSTENELDKQSIKIKLIKLAIENAELLIVLAIIAATALLVIGIVALVKAIKNHNDASAKAAKRLEEANEALAASKKAAQEATQSVKDLKSAWESLQSLKDELNDLTVGTAEWNQKLIEVNEAVLNLIDKYPELARYLTPGKNGLLDISTTGYNTVLKNQQERAQAAQSAQIATTIAQREASVDKQLIDTKYKNTYSDETSKQYVIQNKELLEKLSQFTDEALSEQYGLKRSFDGKIYMTSGMTDEQADRVRKEGDISYQDVATTKYTNFNSEVVSTALKQMLSEGIKIGTPEFYNKLEELTDIPKEALEANKQALLENYTALQANKEATRGLTSALISQQNQGQEGFTTAVGALASADEKSNAERVKNEEEAFEKLTPEQKQEYFEGIYGNNKIVEVKDDGTVEIFDKGDTGGKVENSKETLTSKDAKNIYAELEAAKLSEEDLKKYKERVDFYKKSLGDKLSDDAKERLISTADLSENGYIIKYNLDKANLSQKDLRIFLQLPSSGGFGSYAIKQTQDEEKAKSPGQRLQEQKDAETIEVNSQLKERKIDQKIIDNYVKSYKELHKNSGIAQEDLELIAKKSLLTQEKFNDLTEVYNKNSDALKTANENSSEYITAMTNLQISVNDFLGLEEDAALSYEEVKKFYQDGTIQKVIAGDTEAIKTLRIEAGKKIAFSYDVDVEGFDEKLNEMMSLIQDHDFSINPTLNTDKFTTLLTWMIKETGLTVDQVNEILAGIGTVTFQWVNKKDATDTRAYGGAGENMARRDRLEQLGYELKPVLVANQTHYTPTPSGGGGSSKPKTESKDPYYSVNKQTTSLTNNLDKLSKSKDRAYGPDKLKFIDQEIKAQSQLNDTYKEGIRIAEEEVKRNREGLAKYGVTDKDFDQFGNLTQVAYERLIDRYNELAKTNEDEAEKLKEYLDGFAESNDTLRDFQDKYLEGQTKIIDQMNEKVQVVIDFDVSAAENKIKYLEWLQKRSTSKTFSMADTLVQERQIMNQNQKLYESYTNGIEQMFKERGQSLKDFTEGTDWWKATRDDGTALWDQASIEQLQGYLNSAMDAVDDFVESCKAQIDALGDWLSEYQDGIDKINARIEQQSKMIESYIDIINLAGKERLGITDDDIAQMQAISLEANKTLLANAKSEYETLKDSYETARRLADANSGELGKELQDQADALEKSMQDALDTLLDTWKNALEAAGTLFENNVTRAAEKLTKSMYGGLTAEEYNRALEWQEDIADRYLGDAERIYEISKLNRDIQKSIDSATTGRAAQKLLEEQQALNQYASEHAQMSKYEVDYLRKRYELTQAQIALEEAQNAKSVVRLRRDSEGNYGYVYTADQNKVVDAEQKLEDAVFAVQKLNEDYANETAKLQAQLVQDYTDYVNSLDKTREDYEEQFEKATQFFQEKMAYLTNQSGLAIGNNKNLYGGAIWTAAQTAAMRQVKTNKAYVTSLRETNAGTALALQENETMMDRWSLFSAACVGEVQIAFKDWQTVLGEVFEAAGVKTNDFAELMKKAFINDDNSMKKVLEQAGKDFESFETTAENAFNNIIENIDVTTWNSKINKMIKKIEELEKALEKVSDEDEELTTWRNEKGYGTYNVTTTTGKQALADLRSGKIKEFTATDGTVWTMDSNGDLWATSATYGKQKIVEGGSSGSGSGSSKSKSKTYSGSNNSGSGSNYTITSDLGVSFVANAAAGATMVGGDGSSWKKNADGSTTIKKNGQTYTVPSAATGMYTGEWGADGRLAVLHEKELVLNKADTANFLQAVDIMREIVASIKLDALSASLGLGLPSLTLPMQQPQQLLQNVAITAEFPNATNHSEIEEAFNNLVNNASQYISRH